MDEYASLSHTKWECKYHVVKSQELRTAGCEGPWISDGRGVWVLEERQGRFAGAILGCGGRGDGSNRRQASGGGDTCSDAGRNHSRQGYEEM